MVQSNVMQVSKSLADEVEKIIVGKRKANRIHYNVNSFRWTCTS